jgi:hypothetical protein
MKKLLATLVVVFIVFATIGCNTTPVKPPQKTGRHIKFYVTGGISVASTIQLYEKSIEIIPGQTIYLFQYQTPGLKATLYIDGVPQPDQIEISEDATGPGESHCFNLVNVGVAYDGLGTGFDPKWDAVGKSRIKAMLGEEAIYCPVFTYDCGFNTGYNNGIRLEGLNSKHLSPIRDDCFYWNDWDLMAYVLTGKSYIAGNTSGETWRQDLYNVTEVDLEALAAGVVNRKIFSYQNRIIVAENPFVPGSYVKVVRPGQNFGYTVWDYTTTTEFRQ